MNDSLDFGHDLEQRIRAKIGNRLWDFKIQVSPDGVILSGRAPTFYIKQLVQHSVWEIMPEARLQNTIVVV